MSELITARPRANIRLQLLATVSALSLLSVAASQAKAEDASRATVWIELGGQLSRLENKQELYSPPFLALEPAKLDSPLPSMRPTGYGMEATGALSIQPEDSDWIFSASVRYGRSSNTNRFHQQSYPGIVKADAANGYSYKYYAPLAAQAISATSTNRESHAVLDFLVGRDIGIGLFGRESSSSLSLGVRVAQFQSKSSATLNEDPDWHPFFRTLGFVGTRPIQVANQAYHTYEGQFEAVRSFHGVGPSLSWKSAVPVLDNGQGSEISIDWGLNAAALFGRQRTSTQHHTSAQYHSAGRPPLGNRGPGRVPVYHHPTDAPAYYSTRERNVTVPNVGGFAALSFRYDVAKISFGYRADFFFGAIDGGIDSRKTYDRNFYGPFANISFGLGG